MNLFHKHHTEEAKQKVRIAKKGYIPWNKGKTGIYSEETKKKIGEASKGNKYCLGRILSEETKKKIGEASKRKYYSEEYRRKIGDSAKGRKHTKEAKKKMGLALKRYWKNKG